MFNLTFKYLSSNLRLFLEYLTVSIYTHLSSIGIPSLRVDALVVDDVLEGLAHEATIAAFVSIFTRTVHQVLWTQVYQLPRDLGQLALKGPRRTEGPAGAT